MYGMIDYIQDLMKRIAALEAEVAALREDKARLVEALFRARVHGISGKKCYSALAGLVLEDWIDGGCIGDLPEIVSPLVREAIDAARKDQACPPPTT